jgi:glycosyltransferase involved in cell wall biosynthesis
MKNVVMIAYGFPPEGNAGAYRPLRFVRQLPNLGWMPTVLSALPRVYERYDPALLKIVPNEIEVIRINAGDLWQTFQAWRSRKSSSSVQEGSAGNQQNGEQNGFRAWLREKVHTAEAWRYYPDMAMPWIDPAVDATIKRCQRSPIDVIWATAGPVSSFIVAQRSSVKTGIPYVLDFRDAWTITYNKFEASRPRWAQNLARRTMYQLLNGAKAVIFRYDTEVECFWRAYRGALDASRIYIIPNGYEGEIEHYVAPAGDRCTILYAGTLPDYRYDTLLKALSVLKETDPSRAKQLRLLFVGEGMDALAKKAAALGLSDIIETAQPKSQSEIVHLQREAHALLVLGRPSTMKGYELFAAAKLFGYLKAGRPIIGVLPQDETNKILQRVGVRTVADVDSVSEITTVLRDVLDSWSKGTLSSLVPDRKACEAFSSEQQTATLVRALEGVPPEEPFIPGSQAIPPSLRDVIDSEKWLDGAS